MLGFCCRQSDHHWHNVGSPTELMVIHGLLATTILTPAFGFIHIFITNIFFLSYLAVAPSFGDVELTPQCWRFFFTGLTGKPLDTTDLPVWHSWQKLYSWKTKWLTWITLKMFCHNFTNSLGIDLILVSNITFCVVCGGDCLWVCVWRRQHMYVHDLCMFACVKERYT